MGVSDLNPASIHISLKGFTANPQSASAFDLSPCQEIVEIHAQLRYPWFELITPTLKTVSSRRLRKLTLDILRPKSEIIPGHWVKLDAEIFALANRVDATAGNDVLEVLISWPTTVGGTQLSEIERALPLVSSDARVSLRVESSRALET
jgi:hypothetical protein